VKRRHQVAAFILAGGASSRMGRDKGLLDFGGVPLIVHTVPLIELLAAVYRRERGGPIAPAFARGARKVTDVIEELRVHVVYQHEWRRLDPRAPALKNVNTPGDYEEAQKWRGLERLREGEAVKKPRQARKRKSRPVTLQSG
jgi:molybdopterin-guanine dinucleotide biosynthesis protein A